MPALPNTALAALAALVLCLPGCRTLDGGRADSGAETRDVAPDRQIASSPVNGMTAGGLSPVEPVEPVGPVEPIEPVEISATGRGPSTEYSAAMSATVSAAAPALSVRQEPDGKADNTIVVNVKGKSAAGTDADSERHVNPPVSAQTAANVTPLTYSVYIDGAVGRAGSMDLVVDYDRNAMRFIDSTAAELASGGMVVSNDDGGRLRISGVFINGISGPGRLLKLRFARVGTPSANSTIASGAVFTDVYAKRLDGVGPRNISMLAEK